MNLFNYHNDLVKATAIGGKQGAIVSSIIAPIFIFYILFEYVNTIYLSIWISLHILVYIFRYINSRHILQNYQNNSKSSKKMLFNFILLTSITSLLQSAMIWIAILNNVPISSILLMVIIILAISSGSITTLGNVYISYISFISFMIIPLIGALIYQGGETLLILSFIISVYYLVISKFGYQQYITQRDAVNLKDSFETIFNQTSDGVVLIKGNKFKDCNTSIMKIFNFTSKDEFLAADIATFSPKYQKNGKLSTRKMLKMLNIAWRDGSNSFEWMHLTKDKKKFWAEIVLTKIHLNAEELIYGVWRDISLRKEAEEKLEKLNNTLEKRVSTQILELTKKTALFESIFNTAKDGIAILDLESKFLLVNQAYQDMTGYSKEELYKTSCIDLTVESMVQKSKEVLNILINKGHYEDYEKQCKAKNGEIIDVKMNLVLMNDKKSVLMISRDMTKENKLIALKQEQEEKLLQHSKLAQMGEMISMIAHQWRQPLGAISSTAVNLKLKLELEVFDLSTQDGVKEATIYFNDKLSDIEKFVSNLTNTIDDFRDFYKPNKIAKLIQINVPIVNTLKIIENSLTTDNIQIIKDYNATKDINLFDNEVMQVLLNIFKNAQDNFRLHKIKDAIISIKTYDTPRGITLEIYDNGGGIDENILDKVFEPYFSTKHEKNGTGLGLYMSKMIIEEHHKGNLFVTNIDKGVCFTIEFPQRIGGFDS